MSQGGQLLTPKYDTGTGQCWIGDPDDGINVVTATSDPLTGEVEITDPKLVGIKTGDASEAVAVSNRVILQKALDVGGLITLPPGVTNIDRVVHIGSDTTLTGPRTATLKLASANTPLRTLATSITSSGTTATIQFEEAHGLTGIRRIAVGGVTPLGFCGLWDANFSESPTTATYTLVTSLSGLSATPLPSGIWIGGPYEEYGAVGNLIRNKSWASTRHQLTGFTKLAQNRVGQTRCVFTYAGEPTTWAVGKSIRVSGDTTDAWNGSWEIAALDTLDKTVTLLWNGPEARVQAPAGTIHAQAEDRNIEISGITLDGGITDGSGDASWEAHVALLNRVTNLRIRSARFIGGLKYAIALSNCFDVLADQVDFDTNSDGFHLCGGNRRITSKQITGRTPDDFAVLTANDPEYAYPMNPYPINEGAVMADGSVFGYVDQNGDASKIGLDGWVLEQCFPQMQQARLLFSGSANHINRGVVVRDYAPQFSNMEASQAEIDADRRAGSICLCAEPFNGTTTLWDDFTVDGWTVGAAKKAPHFSFYDIQVGGPYTGQLVVNKLTLKNVRTTEKFPLGVVGVDGGSTFIAMSGIQPRWSVRHMLCENWSLDFDVAGADYKMIELNNSSANGETLDLLEFSKCRFRISNGNWGAELFRVAGAGGSNSGKLKKIVFDGCEFDCGAGHMYPFVVVPGAALSLAPVVVFKNCHFKRITKVVSVNQNATVVIENCTFDVVESGAIIATGSASAVVDLYWANNVVNGQAIFSLASGSTINVRSSDATLSADLTKLSRSGSAGAVLKASGAVGTISSGELCVCSTSGAAGSWKQLSDTSKSY